MTQMSILAKVSIVVLLLSIPIEASNDNSFECTLCNSFASVAVDYLQQVSTLKEVNDLFALRCQKSAAAAACDAVRTTYLPQLFDHLKPDHPTQLACHQSGYCGVDHLKRNDTPQKEATCYVCTEIFDLAKAFVNLTQDEFTNRLQLACHTLDFFDSVCRQIVVEFSSQIYTMTKEEVAPQAACTRIQLCGNDTTERRQLKQEANFESDCPLCGHMVRQARALQKEDQSELSLVTALTNSCALDDSSTHCTRFITEQFGCLFHRLNSKMTAEAVCSMCLSKQCY
uniref:Saposin B-type domain-containing protein n=1 Tax=Plectus sambesii TaxID=2011161 RepID=A0A914W0Z8_9BILA